MTKADLEAWARKIWEEAYKADPYHTEAITLAVLGREVFAWDYLTVRELRALSRGCFATARLARG